MAISTGVVCVRGNVCWGGMCVSTGVYTPDPEADTPPPPDPEGDTPAPTQRETPPPDPEVDTPPREQNDRQV